MTPTTKLSPGCSSVDADTSWSVYQEPNDSTIWVLVHDTTLNPMQSPGMPACQYWELSDMVRVL